MIEEKLIELIQKLKEKTENGQAIWNKTSRDSEFSLKLDDGKITIDNWSEPETESNEVVC